MDNFGDMLDRVATGQADGAIANISITAAREEIMDFTFPIYESGLQIMTRAENNTPSIWSILLRRDLLLAVIGAFAALWGLGMLMWAVERRHQEYFNKSTSEAHFPAF